MIGGPSVQSPRLRLDGDVLDVEAVVEHAAQLLQDGVGVPLAVQFTVRAEGDSTRGESPDVEVVNARHAGHRLQSALKLTDVHVRRDAL